MADSESTTSKSADATSTEASDASPPITQQIRLLTVAGCATPGNAGPVAHIRLMGRWVEQAGFTIGTRVGIEVSSGRLVVILLPEPPELEPHLSLRAQKIAAATRRQASKQRMVAIAEELLTGKYGAHAPH